MGQLDTIKKLKQNRPNVYPEKIEDYEKTLKDIFNSNNPNLIKLVDHNISANKELLNESMSVLNKNNEPSFSNLSKSLINDTFLTKRKNDNYSTPISNKKIKTSNTSNLLPSINPSRNNNNNNFFERGLNNNIDFNDAISNFNKIKADLYER